MDSAKDSVKDSLEKAGQVVAMTAEEVIRKGIEGQARRAFAVYLCQHLRDVRRDQFKAMLYSGELLTKYVGPGQEDFDVVINKLKLFVGRDRLVQTVDEALDGEMIEYVVKNTRPDLYREVIETDDDDDDDDTESDDEESMYGAPGRKWFHDQAEAIKRKTIEMIQRGEI